MNPVRHVLPRMHMLPSTCWGEAGLLERSDAISPLYVERPIGVQNLREFTYHDTAELIYVFRGTPELVWQSTRGNGLEQRRRMYAGTLALLPAGLPHYEFSPYPMDRLYVGLTGTVADAITGDDPLLVESPLLEPLCQTLWSETHSPGTRRGPEIDAWTSLIVHRALRLREETPSGAQDCIDQAMRYLHEHYAQDFTVAELADRYGYSEGYFYRQFKARTGMTPNACLLRIRIRQAMHMLCSSTLSVKRIAAMTGFRDAFYFSRAFRQATGQSPSQVRAVAQSTAPVSDSPSEQTQSEADTARRKRKA